MKVNCIAVSLQLAAARRLEGVSMLQGLPGQNTKQNRTLKTGDQIGDRFESLTMVAAQIRDRTNMTPEEKVSVTSLLDELVSDYGDELLLEHNADLILWQAELAKSELCHSHEMAHFESGGNVHTAGAQVAVARMKHQACAKASKTWSGYSAETCGDVAAPFLDFSATHEALHLAMIKAKADVADYIGIEPVSSSLPLSCTVDQLTFENGLCTWLTAKKLACASEEECLQVVDLSATQATLSSKCTGRRSMKLALLNTQCEILHAIQQIGATGDVVAHACDEEIGGDDDFVCTMTLPQSQNCDVGVDVYPSPATCNAFRQEEYEPWSIDYVKPSQCVVDCNPDAPVPTPAPTPEPTPAPTPDRGIDMRIQQEGYQVFKTLATLNNNFTKAVEACANARPGAKPLGNNLQSKSTGDCQGRLVRFTTGKDHLAVVLGDHTSVKIFMAWGNHGNYNSCDFEFNGGYAFHCENGWCGRHLCSPGQHTAPCHVVCAEPLTS